VTGKLRYLLFPGAVLLLWTAAFASPVYGATAQLKGAGATFPLPFYTAMFDVYRSQSGVEVVYEGVGSSGGVKKLLDRSVDFAGSDAFVGSALTKEGRSRVLQIPTCLGGVAVAYNLTGNPALRLDPDVISDIFLGKISMWDDPRIAAANPGVSLPSAPIHIVHRQEGSGTTFIFSEYLTKVSPEWKRRVGTGQSLHWPVGQGAKANAGVAGLLRQTPNAIGYVELIYALGNGMTTAAVRNRSGRYVLPTTTSIGLSVPEAIPDDTGVSLTDTPAAGGYPISSFTWLVFFQEQNYEGRNRQRAEELLRLLWWTIHDGQKHALRLRYVPLPHIAVKKSEKILESATYDALPLLKGLREGAPERAAR
jgi:phosphate transport system substrate-binding protein